MSETTKLNLSGWTYIGDVIVGVSCDCDCPEQDYNWLQGPHRPHEAHDIIPPIEENDLPEGWTMEAWQAVCRFIADAPRLQAENEKLKEALENIIALGRKDTSNPKYDGYYSEARALLTPAASTRGELQK